MNGAMKCEASTQSKFALHCAACTLYPVPDNSVELEVILPRVEVDPVNAPSSPSLFVGAGFAHPSASELPFVPQGYSSVMQKNISVSANERKIGSNHSSSIMLHCTFCARCVVCIYSLVPLRGMIQYRCCRSLDALCSAQHGSPRRRADVSEMCLVQFSPWWSSPRTPDCRNINSPEGKLLADAMKWTGTRRQLFTCISVSSQGSEHVPTANILE